MANGIPPTGSIERHPRIRRSGEEYFWDFVVGEEYPLMASETKRGEPYKTTGTYVGHFRRGITFKRNGDKFKYVGGHDNTVSWVIDERCSSSSPTFRVIKKLISEDRIVWGP